MRKKMKYCKQNQFMNTDNVRTYKFDSKSVHSNIKSNYTKLVLLDANLLVPNVVPIYNMTEETIYHGRCVVILNSNFYHIEIEKK